jgi:hypothetical protein
MLKSKLEEQLEKQLEELIEELKKARVKAVTIRQYLGTKLIRKSNHQLDFGSKFVLRWSKELKENKKVEIIKLKIEGKELLYNEDITVHTLQGVRSYGDGYDIQCTRKGITISISITTE